MFVRHGGIAILTIGPAALLGRTVTGLLDSHLGAILGVSIGAGVGLLAYVAVQGALGAPELPSSLQFGNRRGATSEVGAS